FLSLFILISLPLRSSLFPYTTLFRSLLLLSFPLLEIDRLYIYLFHSLQSLNPSYPLLNHPFLSRLIQAPLLLALLAIVLFSLNRSEEHTSELQSRFDLVCRLLLEKKT